MASFDIAPDELYKALSERIGALEAENLSLRLLLKQAGETVDKYADRCAELEADLERRRTGDGHDQQGG